MYEHRIVGWSDGPIVLQRHRHEWRHMEALLEAPPEHPRGTGFLRVQNIGVTLSPWRVRDFGDDRIDLLTLEAEVEGDRIKDVPEVTHVGEHAD